MMKNKLLLLILIIASVLRLWKLSSVPASLFGDELDVGYHAYSILKTGRDYYGNPWPIHFHSIAEWRTPLYLYSAVPTVAIFGITPLGVRLPAAIFGVLGVLVFYLLIRELKIENSLEIGNWKLEIAEVGALLLAVNPWSLQYSRAGFEVTLLLFLLLLGLYSFFKSFHRSSFIILSSICFALTPWVYSTAKLFTPMLLLFLFITWRKDFFSIPKRYTLYAIIALIVVGTPIAISTLFGPGAQRFSYISIFTDPTTESEVGAARQVDARVRGEEGVGLKPQLLDRIIHNKYTFWGKNVIDNYFRAFSTDFLFVKGDINLRHSIGTGEFFKIEIVALLVGVVMFFSKYRVSRIKYLMLFWLLAGVIPAAITREGATHATRLILILPPLVFLIAYGWVELTKKFGKPALILLFLLYAISYSLYAHRYFVHYPWESERWWHAGWSEAISAIKSIDNDYDKVVISMSGEPAWIFFAGHYMYDPFLWQKNFPIGNDVDLPGFGKVSHVGKFYFGTPPGGVYGWGQVLDSKTLYLANAKEVGPNLIMEPERTPGDLNLIKAIKFPSGEPAFYIFAKKK